MLTSSEKTKIVAKILKKRIPELSTEYAVHLAFVIVEMLERAETPSKIEIKPTGE